MGQCPRCPARDGGGCTDVECLPGEPDGVRQCGPGERAGADGDGCGCDYGLCVCDGAQKDSRSAQPARVPQGGKVGKRKGQGPVVGVGARPGEFDAHEAASTGGWAR
jgi:hypothetical protein